MRNPLPQHEAIFRFSTDHAGQIYQALQPELSDEVNPRSTTRCRLEGPETLVLEFRRRILQRSGQLSTCTCGSSMLPMRFRD